MAVDIPLKRSKEAVEEDVQRLRDWLDKQPHLPHDVEDKLLLPFVHGTKTLERAKLKLDNYFSNRNWAPKLYCENGRNVNARFREKSSALNKFILSNATSEGYRVFFISKKDGTEKGFEHPHEIVRMLMITELGMMKWPETNGVYLVIDCNGIPPSYITMLSPTAITAGLKCFQDGYPLKLKGVFNINAFPLVEFVVNNLFKPIVKAKLYNRIKVASEGVSFLKEYIPLEMLPSNYGGNDKSCEELNDLWLDLLEENNEWFQQSTKQVSDESKRPPDSENTYGIDGTFRKLSVD